MFDQILKALGGGNIGDIEKNATDLLGRLEKLGADVIGSNGNVVAAVIAVAEDFATIKATVGDLVQIVNDLKAMHAALGAAPGTTPPVQPSVPIAAPWLELRNVAIQAAQVAHVAQPAADAFTAPALPKAPIMTEPHGGA